MALHRLFVALRPPPDVRRALLTLAGGLPGARWQDEGQLHCTLRFIGEVDHHRAEDVAAALGSMRHPPMTLRLGEPGVFGQGGRAEALWVGVTPREDLKALHDKIDRTLVRTGLAPEGRAYVPHITLARFSRRMAPPVEVTGGLLAPPPLAFEVDAFQLFESELGSEGAHYTAVARYPLG
jgi:2'-5' RNA ligase